MPRKKSIGGFDRILRDGARFFSDELGAGCHHSGDLLGLVAVFHDVAGEETDENSGGVDDGERGERETFFVDELEDIADELVRGDGDRILDEAVNVTFDAGDFLHLLAGRHIIVDEAEAAVERHGDRHARLGDGVHVGRDHGNLQPQPIADDSRGVGVLGQNLRIQGGERNVVERERGGKIGAEEGRGRQIELRVSRRGVGGGGRSNLWHRLP